MFAFIVGDCSAPGPAGQDGSESCFDLAPGVGLGKYLTYYSSLDGIVLSAAQSSADILERPALAPVPLLSDGGLARPWPTGQAQVAADALLRARLNSCAALEPESLCALPAVHQMCPCCYEAGGTGCGLLLSRLSDDDAALAADLFHQAYFVLPLASTAHKFRVMQGPESGTRVYRTLLDAGYYAQDAAYAAQKMAALRPPPQPPWGHTAEPSRRALTTGCHPPVRLSGFSLITQFNADISASKVDTAVHIGGLLTSNPNQQAYKQQVRSLTATAEQPGVGPTETTQVDTYETRPAAQPTLTYSYRALHHHRSTRMRRWWSLILAADSSCATKLPNGSILMVPGSARTMRPWTLGTCRPWQAASRTAAQAAATTTRTASCTPSTPSIRGASELDRPSATFVIAGRTLRRMVRALALVKRWLSSLDRTPFAYQKHAPMAVLRASGCPRSSPRMHSSF